MPKEVEYGSTASQSKPGQNTITLVRTSRLELCLEGLFLGEQMCFEVEWVTMCVGMVDSCYFLKVEMRCISCDVDKLLVFCLECSMTLPAKVAADVIRDPSHNTTIAASSTLLGRVEREIPPQDIRTQTQTQLGLRLQHLYSTGS